MRISISTEMAIKVLNVVLHSISIIMGAIISVLFCRKLPYMYIGKTFLIYISIIIIVYVIVRFILCKIFKPIVKSYKERMSY